MATGSASRRQLAGCLFAAGDLFAECDRQGRLTFLAGAVASFAGVDADRLCGRPATLLVREVDRPLLLRLTARAMRSGRAGPLRVVGAAGTLEGRLRAAAAVDPTCVHLALTDLMPVRPEARATVDAEVLLERLRGVLVDGRPRTLALVGLEGIEPIDEEVRRRLVEVIGVVLRAHAREPTDVARLDGGHYALVHEPGREGEMLDDLREAVAREGGGAVDLSVHTFALEARAEDPRLVVEALAHALREFARGALPRDVTGLDRLLRRRMELTVARVRDLRRMLRTGDFALAFQPVVSLVDGTPHHFEALLRPRGHPPCEVVGLAEDVGLVRELDLAVLERVLRELRAVDAARHGLRVAVNLSARSLQEDGHVRRLRAAVEAARIPPGLVLFEITESFACRDPARLGEAAEGLRRAGHRICVDDFGVGAASFAYLRALPVDYVKIDGSFTDPPPGSREEGLLRGMLETCRQLGVRAIAEWVEHRAQARRLAELGAEFGQGFLFGAGTPTLPMPDGTVRLDGPRARRRGVRETWA